MYTYRCLFKRDGTQEKKRPNVLFSGAAETWDSSKNVFLKAHSKTNLRPIQQKTLTHWLLICWYVLFGWKGNQLKSVEIRKETYELQTYGDHLASLPPASSFCSHPFSSFCSLRISSHHISFSRGLFEFKQILVGVGTVRDPTIRYKYNI